MKLRVFTVAALSAFIFVAALPATVNAGHTTYSVTLAGGALAISVPEDAGSLGTRVNTVEPGVISGPLGEVWVGDARSAAAGAGWVVSVISTALTPPAGPTIGAAAIGYTVGPIVQVGTATFTANDPVALDASVAALTATAITGDNSATWNPTINVTVGINLAVGVYSGTITHSVL